MPTQNEDSVSSNSTGFEPEPQQEITPSAMIRNLDESFNSMEESEQNTQNVQDEIPLIQDLPHQIYNPSGTNSLFTIFLIVNAALGAGLLNFPKAFEEAGGIAVAIIVQGILLFFIVSSLNILAYAADRNSSEPAATIENVVGQSVGRIGRILTSFCVAIYCFGVTVTFMIVIGDQCDR